jgi:polysaccharide export outer membrane protein
MKYYRKKLVGNIPSIVAFLVLALLVIPDKSRGQAADYIIGKGDQLLVTVWGYNEFTTTQTVRDNGTITIPLLGDLKAGGLTKDEFIGNLKKRLAEYIQGDINITVSVLSSIGQRVTILGAVTRPANYPVSSEINLLELISMAEGYLPDAQLSGIRIFHKDRTQSQTPVDLDDYLERADIENIPKVRPGDIVFVPKRENVVKEFGEFFRDVALLFTLFRLTDVAR